MWQMRWRAGQQVVRIRRQVADEADEAAGDAASCASSASFAAPSAAPLHEVMARTRHSQTISAALLYSASPALPSLASEADWGTNGQYGQQMRQM